MRINLTLVATVPQEVLLSNIITTTGESILIINDGAGDLRLGFGETANTDCTPIPADGSILYNPRVQYEYISFFSTAGTKVIIQTL